MTTSWCSNAHCGAPLGQLRICPSCGNDEDRALERTFLSDALRALTMADRCIARAWALSVEEQPPRDVVDRIRPVHIAIARRLSEVRGLLLGAGADEGRGYPLGESPGPGAFVALENADVQVRRGFDVLKRETRLDWALLYPQVAALCEGIDAWMDLLRYVHKKLTPKELADWQAGAAWYEQEQRRRRDREPGG